MTSTDLMVVNPWHSASLETLVDELSAVRARALDMESQLDEYVQDAHPGFRESARNLLHYLGLRNFDIRDLQVRLARIGLSSLGRTESHVLPALDAVLNVLRALTTGARPDEMDKTDAFMQGERLLKTHTEALLGPQPERRSVRILVTLPSEAATDRALVRELVAAGMDCARINCAHDDEAAWAQMIAHVHAANRELGRACRIEMDLAGPKARTGPIQAGARVVHIRPKRDERGHTQSPAWVWLHAPTTDTDAKPGEAQTALLVDAQWLARLSVGDEIRFRDARGKRRAFRVESCEPEGCLVTSAEPAYVETGTELRLKRKGRKLRHADDCTTPVGELPPIVEPLVLCTGDRLLLLRPPALGAPAVRDADGKVTEPAQIACTLPEVFRDVRVGDPVALDDGEISAVARAVSEEAIQLEITQAREKGSKLAADKGINFPHSDLRVPALTPKDMADLEFAAQHADLIGFSFVRDAEDVRVLQQELKRRGADQVGILLKIETRRGFEQLPWLILAAMRGYPAGVMIARGDLAVECGWERMAEVQEEILWLCEAAHLPVVWATQVLESLAKTGLPSRAEITDAAMAQRAECVMLNKGPHVDDAIRTLAGILERMQAHQSKKMSMLRSLKISDVLED